MADHNIGLDFGTTYSLIASLREHYDNNGKVISTAPEAWTSAEGVSPFIDSIVVKKQDDSFLFGRSARNYVGRRRSKSYKGFKMLLAEKDSRKLAPRGYDAEFGPKEITKAFLTNLLNSYMEANPSIEKINKIVVGVPAIWFDTASTNDSRSTLQNMLLEIPYIKEVELVSEPAAACTYFADNYKKINNGRLFNGRILLVDYGGGTLDIALCDIAQKSNSTEVTVLRRSGAGLNEEGFIGKAGMAFIEGVVKLALKAHGISEEDAVQHADFYPAVQSVENDLLQSTAKIRNFFAKNRTKDITTLPQVFCEFDKYDDLIPVTYGMLATAYNNIISPVLDEKLTEIIEYMDKRDINWHLNGDDNFKICMVGGFCNFCLTQKQIENKFGFSAAGDARFTGLISDNHSGECEKAIAYGAALIANEVATVKQLAPYHLGFATGTEENLKEIYYVIHKGEEIEYKKPIFAKNSAGDELLFSGSFIPLLIFSFDDKMEYAQWGAVTEKYKSKLTLSEGKTHKIGFSLDRSMRITLHKHIVSDPRKRNVVADKDKSAVQLEDDIYKLLGNIQEVRRVKK